MNLLLGIICGIITFSGTVIIEKIYKKEGLYIWISVATLLANILVCKSIELFQFTTNLGNFLFASSFLASDIICEKYGEKDSRKAIVLATVSQIIFLVMTQFALLYTPSSADIAQESMKTLFTLNLRVSISSISMYFISNMANIYLYDRIKAMIPGKIWLRNNVSTIICNCFENFLFSMLAFIGIYPIQTILEIALVASVIEMLIAFFDTPFLYLSLKK